MALNLTFVVSFALRIKHPGENKCRLSLGEKCVYPFFRGEAM